MKKIIFFVLSIIIFYAGNLFAVPASPNLTDIKQPDGKIFKAKLKGDEFYHWHEDEQGYTILKDTETKFWTYAKKHKLGHLEKSKYIVGKDFPSNIKKGLKDENKLERAKTYRQRVFSQNRSPSLQYDENSLLQKAPVRLSDSDLKNKIENKKNLVILVDFPDKQFSFPPNDKNNYINNLYNQKNYTYDGAVGSVRDYYNEISYSTDTCGMDFIVSSFVVTLDKSYKEYGANDSFGYDLNPKEMIKDTVKKLNKIKFNFRQADGDNDGKVDAFTVVHAGCGEETGSSTDNIWSHQDYLYEKVETWDDERVYAYTTVPELRGTESSSPRLTRIGVIVHELMHIFDIPDLYDTTYQSSGLGNFCLMSHGLWNGNDGNSPAHPCAWVKYELGLIKPKLLSEGKNSIGVSASTNTAFYIIAPENFNSGEYFMIENRQPFGFDKYLPGGNSSANRGLLIYHIDESQLKKKYLNKVNTGNTIDSHYLVAIEEADAKTSDWTLFDLAQNRNKGTSQDYFRNTTVRTFNDDNTSSPNSKNYTGQKSKVSIFDISASSDTMYFWTPDYKTFIEILENSGGIKLITDIMGLNVRKADRSLDEDTEAELAKYFTFTEAGAQEVIDMYGKYNEYKSTNTVTVCGIHKDKMSSFNYIDANLVNKLNYILRISTGQTTKSVGVISFANDAPDNSIEKNNISSGQNMRFTGTELIKNMLSCREEYGYLMPKLESMKLKFEYDIIKVFENTDVSNYKDYIFCAGAKTSFNYDLSKIVCYPNPARNGKITITNLPTKNEKLNIYIFTISGQMVTSFSVEDTQLLGNGTRFFVWDCKTKSGNDIAQGVYIVLIKNNNDKIIKKIAIIR